MMISRQAVLLVLFSFWLFHASLGQGTRISREISGGAGVAGFYGNDAIKDYLHPVAGGTAGIFFRFHFGPHFSVRSGLMYERKGADFQLDNQWFHEHDRYLLNYLTIPIQAGFETSGKVRFFTDLGPCFSYLFWQNYVIQGTNKSYDGLVISPQSEHAIKNFDLGIQAIAGAKFPLSSKLSIQTGLAGCLGLLNTRKIPLYTNTGGLPVNPDNTSYNWSVNLIAGLTYIL